MEAVHQKFLPDPGLKEGEMESLQREIADEAVFRDETGPGPGDCTVAGIDQAFLEGKAVSGVVVMEDGEVVERASGTSGLEIPYIPGLLAFREGSCIVDALESLDADPDVLMLDGSGRIHFRQAGIAVHIGVLFDIPAVGVAKNLLCGELREPAGNLSKGEKVAVEADSSVEAETGLEIGYAYQSRTLSGRKVNPLYVSPGHRVSNETAVNLVEENLSGYKLPEPVRQADSHVTAVKQELQ